MTEGIDDGSTPNGNTTKGYNRILNNNTVLYNISYTITTPGTITLVFTLPSNNYIDSSSISTAAGCITGSKLQKADTVDSNNKTTKSYINNQAICIINPTTTGQKTWTIKANP